MNRLAQEQLRVVAFSAEVAQELVAVLDTVPDCYFYNRKKINSIPTQGTTEANYLFMGDKQMPKELAEYLFALAPKIPTCKLAEACVNRYDVGMGMPEHVDLARYRHNMVVALNDCGDGIEIQGEFVADVPGEGICFPSRSVPHRVPPVQHKRYVLVFLYE